MGHDFSAFDCTPIYVMLLPRHEDIEFVRVQGSQQENGEYVNKEKFDGP
jgi:hypothetical protein